MLALIDELGIADRMRWVETRMGYWYRDRLQPWGNPLALLRFRGLRPVAKFRYGLHAFLSTKRRDWQPLDKIEATGWVRRWVGAEAYDVLWRRLFEYKFYEFSGNLSAAWIWSRIRRLGTSRYSLMREKLGYLDGGSETLLQAMVRSEDEPVRVRGIDPRDDNVAAAFDRMLNHEPHGGETAVTVARKMDYRVDRLVMAMRNARPAAIEVAAK